MTEVVLHKNITFTETKFNHMQAANNVEMSTVQNHESNESFNGKVNARCNNYLESTDCEMNKNNDLLRDGHVTKVVTERAGISSNNLVQTCNVYETDSNIKGYKKVLTTKTTLIKTRRYNVITERQTDKAVMDVNTSVKQSSCLTFPNVMTNAVDNSRVVVQVLKSDLTQNVFESKSCDPGNQNGHSFRDDLYKLLSKPHSSNVDEVYNKALSFGSSIDQVANVSEDDVDTSHVYNASQDDISSKTEELKTCNNKARRKRNFNFYFKNGRGMKVGDLKCVLTNLQKASLISLRYLHYLMFSSFGSCGTALHLMETKKNISNFCGYPFKRSSEQFKKKLKCIAKIPGPMLVGIHQAIFGKIPDLNRSAMRDQVIHFLFFPKKCNDILKKYDKVLKHMPEDEYVALKESVLKGPVLSVVLRRLPERVIRKYTNKCKIKDCEVAANESADCEITANESADREIAANASADREIAANQSADLVKSTRKEHEFPESSHSLPAFILNGPGIKLKHIRRICNNVKTGPEIPISLLHYILYGRLEHNIKSCKRNILEFNGFSGCQQEFFNQIKGTIKKLNQRELLEICKIFCLRVKTCPRNDRIRKILKFLQSPSKENINKAYETSSVPISSRNHHSKKPLSSRSPYRSVSSVPEHFDNSEEVFTNDNGWKLRDFESISSNVECAAPSDLIELNDLLFLKTCDESDIHQKILDFSGFSFPVTSFYYDCRKTLMHYMGFHVLKKIAGLLDIENYDTITNPDDLSSSILKFLMRKVEQDSSCSKSVNSNSVSKPSSPSKSVIDSSSAGSSSLSPSLESCSNTASEHSNSLKSLFSQHKSRDFTHEKKKFIIERVTKASLQTESMCQSLESNKSVQIFGREKLNLHSFNKSEDDSIFLRDLIHHPTDRELKDHVFQILQDNLWSCTLGDLVQKVYAFYPKVNLLYRENFIKTAARQVASELRNYAINAVIKDHKI